MSERGAEEARQAREVAFFCFFEWVREKTSRSYYNIGKGWPFFLWCDVRLSVWWDDAL